jgi:hypothetical protein
MRNPIIDVAATVKKGKNYIKKRGRISIHNQQEEDLEKG